MNADLVRNGFPYGLSTFIYTFTIWWSHNWDETHHQAPSSAAGCDHAEERAGCTSVEKLQSSKLEKSIVRGNFQELPV